MRRTLPMAALAACILVPAVAGPASADAKRDTILAELRAQATRDDPGFSGFSAERGAAFFATTQQGGKPDTPACTSCHGATPQSAGKTRAGKAIEPMAVSANPARYTDPKEVEKWFTRNCNSVVGRECTAAEKGDFITFMASQ